MKRKKIKYIMLSAFAVMALLAFVIPEDRQIPVVTTELVTAINPEICPNPNISFQGGEKIEYKLYYNLNFIWIPAAYVTFRVDDQGDTYHISAVAKTLKSYDWFFKVRDTYEVVMDKATMLPISSKRDVQEGGYKLYEEITYDQQGNVALSLRGKTKEKAVLREFGVSNCIQDILSVIYHTRNLDFKRYEAGQKFPINIFMDKEEWPLQVAYLGEEPKKKIKGMGYYNTVQLQPEVISGEVFDEDTEMFIWASNDQNRIPLLIESPISVGTIKAVMVSTEGLRHEMTAKVDK